MRDAQLGAGLVPTRIKREYKNGSSESQLNDTHGINAMTEVLKLEVAAFLAALAIILTFRILHG